MKFSDFLNGEDASAVLKGLEALDSISRDTKLIRERIFSLKEPAKLNKQTSKELIKLLRKAAATIDLQAECIRNYEELISSFKEIETRRSEVEGMGADVYNEVVDYANDLLDSIR